MVNVIEFGIDMKSARDCVEDRLQCRSIGLRRGGGGGEAAAISPHLGFTPVILLGAQLVIFKGIFWKLKVSFGITEELVWKITGVIQGGVK